MTSAAPVLSLVALLVLAGPPAFVGNASVRVDAGTVVVAPPE